MSNIGCGCCQILMDVNRPATRRKGMARSGTSLGMIIFALLALLLPESSQALDFNLRGRIQSELDANPFLREQGIRLQVVKEENGYVTIEMVEGDKKVREVIDEGVDGLGAGIDNRYLWAGATQSEMKTVNALKRSLAYVKKMEGVKEIQLVAVVNTREDRAEELWRKGLEAEEQKDAPRAVRLYEQAQELGSMLATVRLGGMYLLGLGIPKNTVRGIALIRRAAEQGEINGQLLLGVSYAQGIGVPEDTAMAATWLRKAAEQGHPRAQYLYGAMLAKGEGG
ncbi:MAG: sel1 repeat family protein, partial [Spirochaetia bacterium]|nr:sel1 repeat family protein [Spirochaetia bacterium]